MLRLRRNFVRQAPSCIDSAINLSVPLFVVFPASHRSQCNEHATSHQRVVFVGPQMCCIADDLMFDVGSGARSEGRGTHDIEYIRRTLALVEE